MSRAGSISFFEMEAKVDLVFPRLTLLLSGVRGGRVWGFIVWLFEVKGKKVIVFSRLQLQ